MRNHCLLATVSVDGISVNSRPLIANTLNRVSYTLLSTKGVVI